MTQPHNPARRSHFARLWQIYLRPHLGMMLVAFAFMIIEGGTLGALSYMIKPLFDRVFVDGGEVVLIWIGLGILSLFVIRAVSMVASRTMMTIISQKASTRMQGDLLEHLLSLDSRFFQTNPPGALIERVQGDSLAVQGVWTALLTGVGRDSIALLSLFAVALSIDVRWTLSALIGAPLLILPALALQRYIRRKTTQMRDSAGQRATRLDEIFHGIQAVKLNRMEAYQTSRFREIVARIVRAEVRTAAGRSMMPALIDIVTGIGFFAVLMLGGTEVAAGERTTGEFMAFFTAMALTFQPLRRLGDLSGVWQIAAASMDRIFELFDTLPSRPRVDGSNRLSVGDAPEIRFEDVRFAYAETPVLRGLTFVASAGQMTALVGASGAGKSTVFHLLTGLEAPTSGRILLGGVDIVTLPLQDLRAQIAVVSQDTGLFDETIRENVVLGQNVTPEALANALSTAHVTDFAKALPKGIDTPAGPRGSALSGGQRQRVAIARAVLRDAQVLLLDEATSALDAESEALVSAALTGLGRGRTTLVIAHRLATIRSADQIIVMDQGRVVETGTHDALISRGGRYSELHKLQIADEQTFRSDGSPL